MPVPTEAILVTELATILVNVSSPTDAAPGPLPMAGTDPTCFVATADVCASPTLTKAAVSAGNEPAEAVDDGWEATEVSFAKDMVPALVTMEAAPGPLPIAATEPTCFVTEPATLEDAAGDVGAMVIDGASEAGGAGSAYVDEDFSNTVVVALDSTEAASKPSPIAGTEPICLDGPALDIEAGCTTGDSCDSTDDIEMSRVAELRP